MGAEPRYFGNSETCKLMQPYLAVCKSCGAHGQSTAAAKNTDYTVDYTDGLLTVHTDQGSTSVALRSVRGGA